MKYFRLLQKTGIIFLLGISLSSSAQQDQFKAKIVAKYDSTNLAMPKEKLYIQTDKSTYTTLDTIWFKAYLFDGTLKSASIQSGLIYAEMINYKGDLVKSVALPTGNGMTWGGLALNEKNYPPGNYTLRCYTNWMQNFGDRYFFKKNIRIIGFEGIQMPAITSKITPNSNSTLSKTTNSTYTPNIDLQFLPEGGSWISDRLQTMAFKAINANGKGIKIEGDIVDSRNNKVAEFSSNSKGMGTFKMAPKLEETYTAVIKNGTTLKTEILPKAIAIGTTLQVINSFSSDSLHIRVHSNLNQELIILGQSRGLLCFVTKIEATAKLTSLKLKKDIFPTGISQIFVLNTKHQPLNERNFFVNHNDELKISPSSEKSSYGTRDQISINLKTSDASGNALVGSFSMAVTDDQQIGVDSVNGSNILSYLLLNSEIKGEIENPGSYFNQYDELKHKELESLILTQGWTSYQFQTNQKPIFKPEKDFTISGSVTNLTNKPVAKARVSMIGTNKKFTFLATEANEKGEFVFEKLPAMDSASFAIQALNTKDRRGTLGIKLNEFKRAPISLPTKNQTTPIEQPIDSTVKNLMITQKPPAYKGSGVMLDEVRIVGKKVIKGSKNLNGPGEADQTITEEDLDKVPKKTLYHLLTEQVTGFHVSAIRKSINKAFFIKRSPVKIIIDGMDLDYFYTPFDVLDDHFKFIKSYLDSYNAEDIKGIEVMSSMKNFGNYDQAFLSDSDVYRDQISPGDFRSYIEVTTKTGIGPFLKKTANMYLYKPITYGDFKVFYSPKYTSINKADKKPDVRSTIHWVPNLVTDKNGEAKTSFFSADKKGTYTVWIEGSDMQGNFGMKTMKLEIK